MQDAVERNRERARNRYSTDKEFTGMRHMYRAFEPEEEQQYKYVCISRYGKQYDFTFKPETYERNKRLARERYWSNKLVA